MPGELYQNALRKKFQASIEYILIRPRAQGGSDYSSTWVGLYTSIDFIINADIICCGLTALTSHYCSARICS